METGLVVRGLMTLSSLSRVGEGLLSIVVTLCILLFLIFKYTLPLRLGDIGFIVNDLMTSSSLPHVGGGSSCNHFSNTLLLQVTTRLYSRLALFSAMLARW